MGVWYRSAATAVALGVFGTVSGAVSGIVSPSHASEPVGQPAATAETTLTNPMEALMALSPEHEAMAAMVGTWQVAATFWAHPDAPPETSQGTAVRTLILGGRVVEEVYTSTIMGHPFEGRALSGFDRVTGRYWSLWTDSLNSGATISYGGWDEAAGVFVMEGEGPNLMLGRVMPMRIESRMDGPDRSILAFFTPGPQGSMVQYMELIYDRE